MGQKFLKSPGQKNSRNQINQFDGNLFLTKFHFLQIQNCPKINFWAGKKFKTAKNAISQKLFLIYLISRVFCCLDFFKFSGPLCVVEKIYNYFSRNLQCKQITQPFYANKFSQLFFKSDSTYVYVFSSISGVARNAC